MKIAALIARILLGLAFLVFGANGFYNFMHAPMPPGVAGQYMAVLFSTHYVLAISALEVIGGALLLSGQFIPLALTLLGPLVVNILLFHLLIAKAGVVFGLVTVVLWLIIFVPVRSAFAGIFQQRVD